MRTKAQLDHGVYANAYPIFAAAGGGALARQVIEPQNDFLGWFLPGDSPATVWRCAYDGAACPGAEHGLVVAESKGPHTWDFEILAQTEATIPYYAVGGVTFPDDSYLVAR